MNEKIIFPDLWPGAQTLEQNGLDFSPGSVFKD